MAIVEELKKIGGGTGSTIEEALATGDFGGGGGGLNEKAFYAYTLGATTVNDNGGIQFSVLNENVVFLDSEDNPVELPKEGIAIVKGIFLPQSLDCMSYQFDLSSDNPFKISLANHTGNAVNIFDAWPLAKLAIYN